MTRIATLLAAVLLTLGLTASPVLAGHPHHMHNGSGCRDIPVDVPGQDHDGHVGNGRKFHGALHVGAAAEYDPGTGVGTLGQGNSPNTVAGGSCP